MAVDLGRKRTTSESCGSEQQTSGGGGSLAAGCMIDQAMIDRAARAIYEITGGSIKFGTRRNSKVFVSAQAVALIALEAALADPSETPSRGQTARREAGE